MPKAPKPTRALAPAPLLVKIWITPPIASEPYTLDSGPGTISMRSTWFSGMFSNAVPPAVAEPMRNPSISTMVWRGSAPRMDTPLG
ncbi:hypothetical protein D3C83_31070 [compost metagenome]